MSTYRTNEIERLALVFGALGSAQRLRIFLRLAACGDSGNCCAADAGSISRCVGDLGKGLDLAASTVSHHLKELRRAGLLRMERRGQKIECSIDRDTVRFLAAFFHETGESPDTPETGGDRWRPKKRTKPARTAAPAEKRITKRRAAAASRVRGPGRGR